MTAMTKSRDCRGVPGDGAPARTPPSHDQLEPLNDDMGHGNRVPSLPRRHEYRYARLPNGIPCVVHCWPQRKGDTYVDCYTVHTPSESVTLTEDSIREWWEHALTWHPTGAAHIAVEKAKKSGDWQEALQEATDGDPAMEVVSS